ncbi:hypothetical protein N431DRAFT_485525 [Stipitochalara longipes BDJ]|nr:hypothetical protein N431DRAFT_485525 [Stipitochalara longipes BDJ]
MESSASELIAVDIHQGLYKTISATEYRVVHLLPGEFLDKIQCVLEIQSFKVKTRYEALSYQWGDESITEPIWVACSGASTQPTSEVLTKVLPEGAIRPLAKVSRVLHVAVELYIVPLWITAWIVGTLLQYCFVLSTPLGPPRWAPSFITRDVYIALWCILHGGVYALLLKKTVNLMIEVAETKPWFLTYDFNTGRRGQQGDEEPLDFETLQVTTNLALALRHLRWEQRPRTLWIDALCINQKNEDEKTIQIQRMDWIYANASPVVIWLGPSSQEWNECEHRRQIQAVFKYIWAQSGWHFSRGEEKRFQESRSGFCEIARRGWWERLWVIQEVALATGRIQIQCGHNTCDFDDFRLAQFSMLVNHPEDKVLKDDFRPCEDFLTTIKEFRYSAFHDQQEWVITKVLTIIIMKTMGSFLADISGSVSEFHVQPFAQRLHRILLRTAGRFKCHDDRDRLYAVLGIAGGAKIGEVTQMANFMETLSSYPFSIFIGMQMEFLWGVTGDSGLLAKVVSFTAAFLYSAWIDFYDSRAKHWTINRPDYVVAGYREVIDAVTGGPGARLSRVEFFTTVARYLADETTSLAFLDVATCGEDEDEEMPSWVPTWSREANKEAYDFANRVKKDEALDIFCFTDGGKTLQLFGRSRGTLHVLRSADLDHLQSSPWQGAFEKVLALPSEGRSMVAKLLQTIYTTMYQKTFSMLSGTEKDMILLSISLIEASLERGLASLREAGRTRVYSYDLTVGEVDFLTPRQAAEGDLLVFVPGCFHYLALRSCGEPKEISGRWKLVGLVAMATTALERRGCSKSEWELLVKDGAVCMYNIE